MAPDTKPCPSCAEPILVAAVRCKHCGSSLYGVPDQGAVLAALNTPRPAAPEPDRLAVAQTRLMLAGAEKGTGLAVVLALLLGPLGLLYSSPTAGLLGCLAYLGLWAVMGPLVGVFNIGCAIWAAVAVGLHNGKLRGIVRGR